MNSLHPIKKILKRQNFNMSKFLLLLSVITSIFIFSCGGGGSNTDVETNGIGDSCDKNQCSTIGLNLKVLNGEECENTNSPIVQISIAPQGDFADTCSGTLITPNAVLTAAHCLPATSQGVFVLHEGKVIASQSVVRHPEYRIDEQKNLVFNDIGLVFLSTPVFTRTLPIIVSRAPVAGEKFSTYGFGLTDAGVIGELRSGQQEVFQVTATHISSKFNRTCSNVCAGDSGGPAIQFAKGADGKFVPGIVGVLSSGTDRDCREGDISSFTNINQQNIINFILDNVPGIGKI